MNFLSKLPRLTFATMAALFFVAEATQAQTVFDDGGVNVVNTAQPSFIEVRDSTKGMATTVLVQTGAVIPSNVTTDQSIIVEGASSVEMSGGMTDGALRHVR